MNRLQVAAIVAVSLLAPSAAYAYCPPSAPYFTGSTIRVRIHDQLDENMKHADGTVWTRQELEMAVERVLLRLNASAGADTPWVYLDNTTAPSTCAWFDSVCFDGIDNPDFGSLCGLSNTIHLIPVNCGAMWWYQSKPPATQPSHIIQIERSGSGLGGDMRYDHFPGAVSKYFEQDMLHELGHALGLLHPQTCNWTSVCPTGAAPCAVMASDYNQTLAADYFMRDDSDALRSTYSVRTAPVESVREALDLDLGFSTLGIGNVDLHSFLAASSRPTLSTWNMTIVGYKRLSVPTIPYAYDWDWSSMALTSLGSPNTFSGNGPLGAAHDASNRFATSSSWRLTPDSRKWRRRVVVSTRPIAGSTWSTTVANPTVGALDDTVSAGVSSAFEPQGAVLLTAFRFSQPTPTQIPLPTEGSVLLQDFSGSTFGAPFNTNIKSITAPLIACTTAAAPAKNCILVTVDPGRPVSTSSTQLLRWTEFSWNAAANTWTAGPTHTEPWLMWSDMSLAVHSDALSWEYVVTYQLPTPYTAGGYGYDTYVLRKAPGEANAFTLWGQLTESSQQTSVSFIGGTGPYVEAFNFVHP